jgi:hypothetical protein
MKIRKVSIELDKPRSLLYDVNALIDLGGELKINLMTKEGWETLLGRMATPAPASMDDQPVDQFVPAIPSFEKVRAIVWAGLRHEDETLTVRQVGAMLDPSDLGRVVSAYTDAFQAADITESKSADPNALPPANGAPANGTPANAIAAA